MLHSAKLPTGAKPGLRPWTPLGISGPQTSWLYPSPQQKFLARPLAAGLTSIEGRNCITSSEAAGTAHIHCALAAVSSCAVNCNL